jgi:peptidoglycan/xylan/chitin deacetylase (PgdA/CDA1 family)
MAIQVAVTVDMEQDCPPYLNTWRGVGEGAPVILALLRDEGVPATFFVTGELARKFPAAVHAIVDAGHEVGCHGDSHRRFDRMDAPAAEVEIRDATATLRAFCPVTSFRAPNLQFPPEYLPFLEREGYLLDSSAARYKAPGARVHRAGRVLRVPASMTSSVLRFPAWVRDPLLARLRDPVVLFVHPWEFVDLTRERLRIDCRFRTGEPARRSLAEVVRLFKRRGATLVRMRDLQPSADRPGLGAV